MTKFLYAYNKGADQLCRFFCTFAKLAADHSNAIANETEYLIGKHQKFETIYPI